VTCAVWKQRRCKWGFKEKRDKWLHVITIQKSMERQISVMLQILIYLSEHKIWREVNNNPATVRQSGVRSPNEENITYPTLPVSSLYITRRKRYSLNDEVYREVHLQICFLKLNNKKLSIWIIKIRYLYNQLPRQNIITDWDKNKTNKITKYDSIPVHPSLHPSCS
jgi:hypothetical protein